MKKLSWNARGMGSTRGFQILISFKKAHNPNIIFLMETKANNVLMERIRVQLGFVGKLVVNCVGRSGGLCLFWADSVDVSLLSYSLFHIDVQIVTHQNTLWRLTGFYGHPEVNQRHHGWQLLRRLNSMSGLPWICIGDFNKIIDDSEKLGVCNVIVLQLMILDWLWMIVDF